jgi:hypothetical protein
MYNYIKSTYALITTGENSLTKHKIKNGKKKLNMKKKE